MLVDYQFFSNFYLHWFFSNLSFFERDPRMDSPEGIRVKAPCLLLHKSILSSSSEEHLRLFFKELLISLFFYQSTLSLLHKSTSTFSS